MVIVGTHTSWKRRMSFSVTGGNKFHCVEPFVTLSLSVKMQSTVAGERDGLVFLFPRGGIQVCNIDVSGTVKHSRPLGMQSRAAEHIFLDTR
jgi:hypothetical protein